MTLFDLAFNWMIKHEVGADPNGGYTNDPDDPGGETCWGIAKRFHPEVNIDTLTKDEAKVIYKVYYWTPLNLEAIGAFYPRLAIKIFDTGVNIGIGRAGKILQKALNSLDPDYPLEVDGKIGRFTVAKVAKFSELELLESFMQLQRDHYFKIGNTKFIKGWLRRADDIPTDKDAAVIPAELPSSGEQNA